MASLIPPKRDVVRANTPSAEDRAALFGGDAAQMDKPQHMARLLSWALADLMLAHPEIVIAGEDVGPKGGVYNVTAQPPQRFGPARVVNTLLDEPAILGLAIGIDRKSVALGKGVCVRLDLGGRRIIKNTTDRTK